MIIENGKIVLATDTELLKLYLDRGMDNIMTFPEYKMRMEHAGCEILVRDEL